MRLVLSIRPTKYYVEEPYEHTLQQKYTIYKEFDNGFHYLHKKENGEWVVGAHQGCRYDGVTKWRDREIFLKGALVHDILHWLIDDGYISPYDNNKIDAELEIVILSSNLDYPWWRGGRPVLRLRARAIRCATNMVDQKVHENKRIIIIP